MSFPFTCSKVLDMGMLPFPILLSARAIPLYYSVVIFAWWDPGPCPFALYELPIKAQWGLSGEYFYLSTKVPVPLSYVFDVAWTLQSPLCKLLRHVTRVWVCTFSSRCFVTLSVELLVVLCEYGQSTHEIVFSSVVDLGSINLSTFGLY